MPRAQARTARVAHYFSRVLPWVATVLLLWPARPALAADLDPNPGLLTKVAEIKNLTPGEAAHAYPAVLQGVITLSAPLHFLTFLQDETGAIYLAGAESFNQPLKPGDEVEIRGVTAPGRFAPVLTVQSIRILGSAPLPDPRRLTSGDLGAGRLDSQYVQIEGVVRSAQLSQMLNGSDSYMRIDLATASRNVAVLVLSPRKLDSEALIGATIRVRGPLGIAANNRHQLVEERILVDGKGLDRLQVLSRESFDPFKSAPMPIPGLLRYRSVSSGGSRVRIQGFITLINENHYVILQKGGHGIKVKSLQHIDWPVGSFVDAVGFPELGDNGPILADAEFRFISASPPPAPIEMTAQQASSGDHDGTLIRVRGYLIAQLHADRHVLWVQSGDDYFLASIDKPLPRDKVDRIKFGTFLELTGVSGRVQFESQHAPIAFHIYMRSIDDVKVLRPPNWWNGIHALEVLIVAIFLGVAVMAWNIILRQRVRRQTILLKRTARFERGRNQILEMVGRNASLESILAQIRELTERQIRGCRCIIELQERAPDPRSAWSTLITSATGQPLAVFSVRFETERDPEVVQPELLNSMARLAGIAIEQRSLYDRLCHQSQRDALTGVANRVTLQESLAAAMCDSRHLGLRVACLYLDLDGFKKVNDTLGHRAGDIVLKCIASRLVSSARDTDTVARIGGDEFCLILPKVSDVSNALEIAQRLIRAVEAPISVEDRIVNVSGSIGISFFPDHATDSDALCRCADAALYVMKSNGKAGYCVFEPKVSAPLQIAS